MKLISSAIVFSLVFLGVSCSQTVKDPSRFPSSTNEVAVERVADACDMNYNKLANLIFENAVVDEARYLSGGVGYQTFLMKDGRLVIVSGVNKRAKNSDRCKIDHLRMDEGPILGTYAMGRRLYMTIENEENGKRRVYLLTAVKNQKAAEPYQLHEMQYTRSSSYAQAYGFRRTSVETDKGNKYGILILKESGEPYANRSFRPWEWGDNNEFIANATNDKARKITIRDEREKADLFLPVQQQVQDRPVQQQQQQTVTYLPRPAQTCQVEERVSFFFGLFSVSETVTVPCR